jgi:hypothetical protein
MRILTLIKIKAAWKTLIRAGQMPVMQGTYPHLQTDSVDKIVSNRARTIASR